MPVTSYEVGAIFRIVDAASPVLTRISAQLTAMQARIDAVKASFTSIASTRMTDLTDRLAGVNTQIAQMGKGAEGSATAVSAAFAKIDASAAASLDSLRALKTEVGEIAAGSRAIRAPAGIRRRAGEAHAGGGGGLGGLSGPSFSIPGGSRFHMGGTSTMAGLGLLGYGAYQDAKIEDAIFQLEYHTGMANTPQNSAMFRSVIQNAMSKTGMPIDSVIAAAKQEVRMFKGTPGGGVAVLPEMLSAAATEARLKGSSLEESMSALIGLAHMTKQYDPEQIKKLAPAFAFLSASNPASLAGIERAASYAVPILQSGLEIDPVQSLLLGTALTRAGATNTKSGTWLRNMALNAMPGTSLMSQIAFRKHEEALKALGLVDVQDNPTWFTAGKPDLVKLLSIASSNAAAIPLTKRAAYEKQLFGMQGFGGFALLADPAVKAQIAELTKEMGSSAFKNRYASFMQDYNAQSPLQLARTSFADLNNILADIGQKTMPFVVKDFRGLDDILNVIAHPLQAFSDGLLMVKNALGFLGPSAPAGKPVPVPSPFGIGPHPGGLAPPLSAPDVPGKQSMNNTPVNIRTAVYLDGRVIGETVSSELAQLSTFPRQASYGDTYLGWAAPDYNFSTG